MCDKLEAYAPWLRQYNVKHIMTLLDVLQDYTETLCVKMKWYEVSKDNVVTFYVLQAEGHGADDDISVFTSWNSVMDYLKKYEGLRAKLEGLGFKEIYKTWLLLLPEYIDDSYKALINDELCSIVNNADESSFSALDLERLNNWYQYCK